MADVYEFFIAADLRADLTDDEVAELRWHLGQGPQPERFPIGTDAFADAFPLGDPDDPDCEWETDPQPVFAQRGPAWRVGGALVAELVRRDEPASWALTVRQELHPDIFYPIRTLLDWLGSHLLDPGGLSFVGYLRFYEDTGIEQLTVTDGVVTTPADIVAHTPLWQSADRPR